MTGAGARKKGHAFETKFCGLLRFFGWEAVTSRSESKNLDDKGVDVVDNTPFYFQLKAVERLNESYWDILDKMPTEKHRTVVHKRNHKMPIVVMYLEDFEALHLNKGYSSKEIFP